MAQGEMETKAALSAVAAEPVPSGQYSKVTAPEPSAGALPVPESRADSAEPQPAEPQPGDLRLVIEQDEESGAFIYKTVDRRTGETLQVLPREDVLKLKHAANYDPGDVYDGLT
jgi:flagellar protein FlaG